MKTPFHILILILTLFITTGNFSFAQQEFSLTNLDILSEKEMLSHQLLMNPRESMIVNNYDLKYHRFFWVADPARTYISGSVTSYFVSTQPAMNSIQFELSAGMVVDSAFYKSMNHSISHVGGVITVPFAVPVVKGILDSVTVYYHGNPTTTGFGSFGNEIHGGAPGMWTLSEPYGAADWWPSKNDLTDKIDSIDVFVVTPKGNHVASNGLLISEKPYGVNSILVHWKHRYPIASYLIAIASTNYARFSDYLVNGTDSLEVLNYVYPEDSVLLRTNAKAVVSSIALFESLFTPYPYRAEKYGQAQFGWGGGMEHQTMTFLGKGAFNPDIEAHELAHQWFGDMITCGSWHDIWLNEGFATYCAGLMYEHTSKDLYWPIWKRSKISHVCYLPGGSVYCDDTSSVGRIFDSRLSYSKGGMVLHMLRWVMGDENFFAGMKNYLNDPKLQYGFARTADFKAHMYAASGKDLSGFFADWIYGEGYPSYTISTQQMPDHRTTVTISQKQSHASVSFFELPVPVQFFGEGKDTMLVFNNTFSGETFLVNPGFQIDSLKFDPEMWLISSNNLFTLGIDDLPEGKSFVLSPNPASDMMSAQHNLGKISSIRLFSLDGKQQPILTEKANNNRLNFNIQNLKAGMYLLRVGSKYGIITRKFVVKQ